MIGRCFVTKVCKGTGIAPPPDRYSNDTPRLSKVQRCVCPFYRRKLIMCSLVDLQAALAAQPSSEEVKKLLAAAQRLWTSTRARQPSHRPRHPCWDAQSHSNNSHHSHSHSHSYKSNSTNKQIPRAQSLRLPHRLGRCPRPVSQSRKTLLLLPWRRYRRTRRQTRQRYGGSAATSSGTAAPGFRGTRLWFFVHMSDAQMYFMFMQSATLLVRRWLRPV